MERSSNLAFVCEDKDLNDMQLCLERDRLLASEEFARSPLMTQLLKYLVEQQLIEDGQALTSHIIAEEALGKTSQDGNDANVYARVQIGRLRQVMDGFYAKHGGVSRLHPPNGTYRFEIVPIGVKQESFPTQELASDIASSSPDDSDTHARSEHEEDNTPEQAQDLPSADYTKVYYLSAVTVVIALLIFVFAR